MCSILHSDLANLFSKLAFGEEILFHKPSERPEKAIVSVLKSYLVHLKVLNAIFCIPWIHCWEIWSHWGEVHKAIFVVVSVGTNGSNKFGVSWGHLAFISVSSCWLLPEYSVYNLAGFFMCLITFVLGNTDPTQREGICWFGDQHWNLCSIWVVLLA